MKTLAILGGAELTRDGIARSQADEIWTINWSYLYDWVPRIDRLFEMHPIWLYGQTGKPEHKKIYDHWRWLLESEKPFPVYMLAKINQIPSCVRYPIEGVIESVFDHKLLREEIPTDFFGSSVDYMIGLAIHEKKTGILDWDRLELHGVEMGSITEYRYQRESVAFFVGRAMEHMTVVLPTKSVLLRSKRYGYRGGEMIFRQDLDRMLMDFSKKQGLAMSRLNHLEGQAGQLQLKAVKKKESFWIRLLRFFHLVPPLQAENPYPQEFMDLQVKVIEARDEVLMASSWVQLLQYQLQEIDLEEPSYDLVNPLNLSLVDLIDEKKQLEPDTA
jgi:hypothetical protein